MTPQELAMTVGQLSSTVADIVPRLEAVERDLRRIARKMAMAAPPPAPAPRPRPSRRELRIVDAALAQVARDTGIVALEILNGGRGADLVAARRSVAVLARGEGLSDGAIARAMGCDRSAISHALRKLEGEA